MADLDQRQREQNYKDAVRLLEIDLVQALSCVRASIHPAGTVSDPLAIQEDISRVDRKWDTVKRLVRSMI